MLIQYVLIQLGLDKEVAEVMKFAKDLHLSPFTVLERWMEVIEFPRHPR